MSNKNMVLTLFLFFLLAMQGSPQTLTSSYYQTSCPQIFEKVHSAVASAVTAEPRVGASLLRLFFHDCFVNGCDGSILLDDSANFTGEKGAFPNKESARGFEVIDDAKADVEEACPGVVSCADILAIAARDSVVMLGGPTWSPKLGRKDARTASQAAANANLPAPSSNITQLLSVFGSLGFTPRDLVALSGAHTIGMGRCTTFRSRIYNDTNINRGFAASLRNKCPAVQGIGDDNLASIANTSEIFDNSYFVGLKDSRGLFHSDQELYSSVTTAQLVETYIKSEHTFFMDFVEAMLKMGDLPPSAGVHEIRKNCRIRNA